MSSLLEKLVPCVVAGLLALSAVPAGANEGEATPTWCSALLTAAPVVEEPQPRPKSGRSAVRAQPQAAGLVAIPRRSATWTLAAFGAVATGELVEEFEPLPTGGTARYGLVPPPGVRLGRVLVDVEGDEVELELRDPRRDRRKGQGRGRVRLASPMPGGRVTDEFTVPAGIPVRVRVEVEMPLSLSAGTYELGLPHLTDDCRRGDGEAAGELRLALTVHHGDDAFVEVDSPTHDLADLPDRRATLVELAGAVDAAEPVVVRFGLGRPDDQSALTSFVGKDENGEREVVLVLDPPAEVPEGEARATSVIFVIDSSGSMKGEKFAFARLAVLRCLQTLGADDSFNVVRFRTDAVAWEDGAVPAEDGWRDEATDWLMELDGEGGTALMPGLRTAFESPKGEGHPLVVVLTDGRIGDEDRALEFLDRHLGGARLLVVGIGGDQQSDTLVRLAERGRGDAAIAQGPAGIAAAMTRLFGTFSQPVAWDIELDWQGADAELVWPTHLPDLYAGRPVTVLARIRGDLPEDVQVVGTTIDGEGALQLRARLADAEESDGFARLGRRARAADED